MAPLSPSPPYALRLSGLGARIPLDEDGREMGWPSIGVCRGRGTEEGTKPRAHTHSQVSFDHDIICFDHGRKRSLVKIITQWHMDSDEVLKLRWQDMRRKASEFGQPILRFSFCFTTQTKPSTSFYSDEAMNHARIILILELYSDN